MSIRSVCKSKENELLPIHDEKPSLLLKIKRLLGASV